MHYCSYAHEFESIPDVVRQALEAEAYDAFMRGNTAAAEPQQISSPAQIPQPLAGTTRRLLATASFAAYTRGNHALSERVAHEAVSWCDSQWARVEDEDPLVQEEDSLHEFLTSDTLTAARRRLPPESRRAVRAFAETVLSGGQAETDAVPTGRERVAVKARIALVAEKWRAALDAERQTHQTRELGRTLGSFVRELRSSIPDLARAQSIVRDLFGTDAAVWDLNRGQWTELDWTSLEDHARILQELPELKRLAEILGRSRVSTENISTTKVVRDVVTRPVGLGKSEVTGVNFGDDLTSLLPSEIALLADPLTEDLFYAKLAHKELLQLDYRRERVVQHTRERMITTTEEVEVSRGPVILCIDTSGSMLGDPESIGKAMTLALATQLQTDRRDLHVIAFSTEIRALTLAAAADLPGLCRFLAGSFHGGTDLRPALAETLQVLDTGRFVNADVLIISDFRVPKIADRFINSIKSQQRRGTLFHSLTVARGAVRDPLHIFDNSWLFDISEGLRGIRPDTLRFLR